MLHGEIYELVRHARMLGFMKVMMISNAYLLSEKKVSRLNEAGLQELQISVDGVEPNDVTIKVLNPLRRKLTMLARSAKFRVVMSAVLGSAPPAEVLEVVRFAKNHGFIPRVLVLHDGEGQLNMSVDDLATFAEIKKILGGRFNEAGDYRSRLLKEGQAPFKCRAGSRYLYVDEFGVVRWCSQTRAAFGIPLEQYTFHDLKEQFNLVKDCHAHCTVGCARTCSAYDFWRPQTQR